MIKALLVKTKWVKPILLTTLIIKITFYTPLLYSFTLEKTIPDGSMYGGIEIKDNINTLLYKVISPSFKDILYPQKDISQSTIQRVITSLRTLGIKDLEFFTHNDWNILVKINSTKLKEVSDLLALFLDEENFMSKVQVVSKTDMTIISKNPEMQGNEFYLHKEGQFILLATKMAALNAWKARNTPVLLYEKGLEALKTPDMIGFLYGIDNIYADNKPTFVTVSSNNNSSKIHLEGITKNKPAPVVFPSFLKDDPILFFTAAQNLTHSKITTISNLLKTAYIFLPSLRAPFSTVFSQTIGLEKMSVEFKEGGLVDINEKKMENIDMTFVLSFTDPKKVEEALGTLKNNKLLNLTRQDAKDQTIFILTPKNQQAMAMGIIPVYMVLNSDGFLALSMNKKSLLEIANNMSSKKSSLRIHGETNASILYINVSEMIDKFPIMASLAGQFGIDIRSIESIHAPSEFIEVDAEYSKATLDLIFK